MDWRKYIIPSGPCLKVCTRWCESSVPNPERTTLRLSALPLPVVS